jgi:hypothetical protein
MEAKHFAVHVIGSNMVMEVVANELVARPLWQLIFVSHMATI